MKFKSVAAAIGWYAQAGGDRKEPNGSALVAVAIREALNSVGADQDRLVTHLLRGRRMAWNDLRTRRALQRFRTRLVAEGLLD